MRVRRLVYTVVSGLLMLAVMITIFVFSNQKGETSSVASNSAGSFLLELLHIEIPEGQNPDTVPIIFSFTVRNLAHIFLYGCLGLTSYLFSLSGLALLEVYDRGLKEQAMRFRSLIAAAIAFGVSLLFGCFDELHQFFVDGRSATFRDIGIDTIGIVLAIGLSLAVTLLSEWLYRRKDVKKDKEKWKKTVQNS